MNSNRRLTQFDYVNYKYYTYNILNTLSETEKRCSKALTVVNSFLRSQQETIKKGTNDENSVIAKNLCSPV